MPNGRLDLSELHAALAGADARWRADLTTIAALSPEQARLRLGYTPGPEDPSLQERERMATEAAGGEPGAPGAPAAGPGGPAGAPPSYDWRNVGGQNFVTPIKDQGGCGSCVAFGSCATVESAVRISRNDSGLAVDLSEAQLFYCIARSQGRMCSGPNGGWWPDSALNAFESTGVADENCYPYTAGDQNCTNLCSNWQQRVTKVTAFHSISNTADMKTWLSTRGPLETCFTVYNDFYYYASGVYHHVSGGIEGGHCVCVIGYDDTQGCWICKNSWGTGWGLSGFFMIGYGECGIDAQMWAVDGVTGGPTGTGRLEAFARGTDNALWHIWQTAPSNGWSGWASLGGGLTSDTAVVRNADGRLEAFVRGTDNALWHIWQTAPNNGWSGWASLGGVITTDPTASANADGRLEIFARGTDNALWHIWQTAPNNGWSSWASLGGGLTSNIALVNNADGRLEAFVRGTDNALWHIWQTAPNNGWSSWASLGGVLTSDIAVGRNADGRLEAFVRGTDNALWHIWQTSPNNGWSSWASLGGVITTDPTVSANADGRLEVFARGTDNALWHIWQTAPNDGWSSWASLGGGLTSNIALGRNADGRLEVFVRGTDNALWHIWQTAPNNGWSSWASLGGVITTMASVGANG